MTLVLAYHHVSPTRRMASTHPAVFDEHLRELKAAGYALVTQDEFEQVAGRGFRGAGRTALVTFDDGHADNWIHAAPVLAAHHAPATIFVITGDVDEGAARTAAQEPQLAPGEDEDRAFRIRWDELRAWSATGALSVQTHTHGHRDWRAAELARVREGTAGESTLAQALADDLLVTARVLRERLGVSPTSLAWPWGYSTPGMRRVATRHGLAWQFGVVPGVNGPWSAPDRLHRFAIDGWPAVRLRELLRRLRWQPLAAAYSVLRDLHRRFRP